jgi:GGDEF domain-containing protein/putative methionine-R-sulfoxide reductase with GAF domain
MTSLLQHLFRLDGQAGLAIAGDVVSDHLRRLTPATLVVFYMRDVEANDLVAVHASGYGADLVDGLRMPLGKNVSGWVAVNGQSIITDPILDAVAPLGDVAPRFQSLLSVPLAADESVIGVVTLYATGENAFQDEQRQAIELVSGAIAEALARALEHDRARLDLFPAGELAGVASRRALDELLARDRRRAPVTGRTRAVLYLTNEGGAAVMLHAMMAVSHSTRIADLIFRPSEDSLVVLLKDADASAEALIVQRIAAILPADIVAPPSDASPLSLGFACSPQDGDSLDELLNAAGSRARRATAARAPVDAPPAQRGLPWKV